MAAVRLHLAPGQCNVMQLLAGVKRREFAFY
ncbi:hypothetical protein K2D_22120 [Planctomycetes bacterium K2D]|uniref:Uncharacterized protein n=1 Tax=Botrimarina mediterranea TaxID=2528022 RepID=A0A518K861_9BACT|nr:hypothetical protein Spa11_21740 [Botrimarina mediterranea]QDV78605.1 hypothetical protein K2D_22120 [Planctomycetes bacterium K2D]